MNNKQQKLGKRNTYTPTDASQVCSPVVMSLNREDTLGEHSLKTCSNNLDENRRQHTDGHKVNVYVLNKNRKPLMPCTQAKARHLLKQNKAEIIKRTPFVIRLLWDCEDNTQDITLGIDSGYKEVGFSAVTEKEELISGELKLRTNIPKLIEQKSNYRRTRRGRLWYRQPRFNNRKIKKGWLAPSMQNKLDAHIRLVSKIKQWLPVTDVIVEVAKFDTQKMQNPDIKGIEYQQGELQGYEIREYLLEKFKRKCVYCGKDKIRLEVEHIIPKSRGGSNRVSNLTTACKKCNLDKGNKTAEEYGFPEIQTLAKTSLKSTVFMNIVRKILVKELDCKETYGYITKCRRIKNNTDKSHINDAFIIAEGLFQERCQPFQVKQQRRNNRSIQTNRKGFKPSIRRQRYKLQPNDLVRFDGKEVRVRGMSGYGKSVRLSNNKFINSNKIKLITYGKGLSFNINSLLVNSVMGVIVSV